MGIREAPPSNMSKIQLTIVRRDSRNEVLLTGDLTVFTYKELRQKIMEKIDETNSDWILDLSGIEHVDSSGMAVLAAINSKIQQFAGSFEITNTPPAVLQMFQLTGLENVFKFS